MQLRLQSVQVLSHRSSQLCSDVISIKWAKITSGNLAVNKPTDNTTYSAANHTADGEINGRRTTEKPKQSDAKQDAEPAAQDTTTQSRKTATTLECLTITSAVNAATLGS